MALVPAHWPQLVTVQKIHSYSEQLSTCACDLPDVRESALAVVTTSE